MTRLLLEYVLTNGSNLSVAMQVGAAGLFRGHSLHHLPVAVSGRLGSAMTISSPVHPPRKVAVPLAAAATTAEALARAKGYPYPRPETSFIFVNGPNSDAAAYTFDNVSWVPPSQWQGSVQHLMDLQVTGPTGANTSLADVMSAAGVHPSVLTADTPLTAILATGSNAGPAQLARKFPVELFPEGVVIPVIQCVLRDFDVVYAPYIASYGSATATLEASPGTDVSVFITYLTPPLQQRMHETEGGYNLLRLEGIQLLEGLALEQHMQGAAPVCVQQQVYQYNHKSGTLHLPFSNPGNSPVALAEVTAHNRKFPPLTQVQMQAALSTALRDVAPQHRVGAHQDAAAAAAAAPADLWPLPSAGELTGSEQHLGSSSSSSDAALDDWILSNLQQTALRRARVAALTKAAKPLQYERAVVVLVIGADSNVK